MKFKTLFIINILILGMYGCLKDDASIMPEAAKTHKYFSIDDFDPAAFLTKYLRDGGQNPFQFATSQVEYDPFKPGYPQTVINIQRLDSVKYYRTSQPNANAFDTEFDIYNITYFFKDGSTKQSNRIYAESILGAAYTYLPDTDYNQLSVNNPNNFETLKRGVRSEPYPDHDCGKEKKRFSYTHYFNLDSVGVSPINGDRCASNVFSYQLITIE